MTRGSPTDLETINEFRALYLIGGSIPSAAKEVGIPERTAYEIAKRLEEDANFAEDRRRLQERALERLVSLRMRVAEVAQDRFENGSVDEQEFGDSVTVVDKRQDYGRLVIEAERNAQHLAKLEDGPSDRGGPVNVIVCPTPEAAERAAVAGAKGGADAPGDSED